MIRHAISRSLLVLPLILLAGPLAAMEAPDGEREQDTRWLAWLGCWEDAEGDDGLLVCFYPLSGVDGVEIRTYLDDEMLAVEDVVADGRAVPVTEGGCEGTRTARWSEDGARVFITSELRCGEGVTRTTSGVMALSDRGRELLEIHASGATGHDPVVGARKFIPASRSSLETAGVEAPARDRHLAVQTARSVVSAPLDPGDVVEAVDIVGGDVTRALIAEIGAPFALSASLARDLARQGVPGDVLDVMVAVSHPERFDVEGTTWEASEAPPVRAADYGTRAAPWSTRRRAPIHIGYGFYDPFFFGSGFYGPGWYYPGFVGGPFPGRVIVVQPRVRDRQARVSPNSGYTRPTVSDRSAVRRDGGTARAQPAAPPSTTRTPIRSGDRPSATSRPTTTRVTPQGTRTNRTNTERRARPRGGGNPDGGS